MYRVFITARGSFRAVKAGIDPETNDIANSFESDYWHSFQAELHKRLRDDSPADVREIEPGKERRKRGDQLL